MTTPDVLASIKPRADALERACRDVGRHVFVVMAVTTTIGGPSPSYIQLKSSSVKLLIAATNERKRQHSPLLFLSPSQASPSMAALLDTLLLYLGGVVSP